MSWLVHIYTSCESTKLPKMISSPKLTWRRHPKIDALKMTFFLMMPCFWCGALSFTQTTYPAWQIGYWFRAVFPSWSGSCLFAPKAEEDAIAAGKKLKDEAISRHFCRWLIFTTGLQLRNGSLNGIFYMLEDCRILIERKSAVSAKWPLISLINISLGSGFANITVIEHQ